MQGNASLNVAWLLPKRDDRVNKLFCLMFNAEGLKASTLPGEGNSNSPQFQI
jgi:hypothetical protein